MRESVYKKKEKKRRRNALELATLSGSLAMKIPKNLLFLWRCVNHSWNNSSKNTNRLTVSERESQREAERAIQLWHDVLFWPPLIWCWAHEKLFNVLNNVLLFIFILVYWNEIDIFVSMRHYCCRSHTCPTFCCAIDSMSECVCVCTIGRKADSMRSHSNNSFYFMRLIAFQMQFHVWVVCNWECYKPTVGRCHSPHSRFIAFFAFPLLHGFGKSENVSIWMLACVFDKFGTKLTATQCVIKSDEYISC